MTQPNTANTAAEPFLPPSYEAVLTPFDTIFSELDFPSNPDMGIMKQLKGHIKRIRRASAGIAEFIHDEDTMVAEDVHGSEDLRHWLAIMATSMHSRDLLLKTMAKTTALATAFSVVEGDSLAAGIGEGVAMRVNLQRARLTVTSQLGAADGLLTFFHGIDEGGSTWQRAVAAHANRPKVRPPVAIGEAEGSAFAKTVDMFRAHDHSPQSEPLIELGRSRLLNSIRIARFTHQAMSGIGPSGRENFEIVSALVETLIASMPTPMELSPAVMRAIWQASARMNLYLQSASKLDRSLATDPKAQYFQYLVSNMDGYNIQAENVYFKPAVKAATARLEKQMPKTKTTKPKTTPTPDNERRNS